jgi:hypothetical protein
MRDAAAMVVMVLTLALTACGGERRTDSAAGGPSNTGAASDTAPPAAPAPAPSADTAAPTDTTPPPAAERKPAPRPAPKPAPQAPAPSPAASQAEQSAPLRDAYHQAPRDTVSQAVYDGWKQYNLNCARCHGEDVLGTTIAPHLILSLKPDGPINTKELFVQTVCAGRPEKGMPSWCALGMDMEKINQVYEYVHGRSAAKIGPGRPAVKQEG